MVKQSKVNKANNQHSFELKQAQQMQKTQQAQQMQQMQQSQQSKQPVINVGMVGHIDHGKTTLLYKLTGVWASKHSEELKRGITIRLGYADSVIKKCSKNSEHGYTISEKCSKCGEKTEIVKYVSFVDAPGHEMLMATMLSGAAIIDAAILVIAANEKCPQPQTKEHLAALTIKGIKNIIIVQSKIDLVSREQALQNHHEILEFVKNTVAENAPIIPISAQHDVNIDLLLEAIDTFPVSNRDVNSIPLFFIARSFDINKPGTNVSELVGGVIGGTLKQGTFKEGDELEIRPGLIDDKTNQNKVIKTKISGIASGKNKLSQAMPSGSLAISTLLDPFITKSDNLAGNIAGLAGKLPEVVRELKFKPQLFERVVGTQKEIAVEQLKMNEILLLSVNTAVTIGNVREIKKDSVKVLLKIPTCPIKGSEIGIARNLQGKWRLIGYGVVE